MICINGPGSYLRHWGILGQKWGLRRFRNKDGTLTEEGKKRYGNSSSDEVKSFKERRHEKKVRNADISKMNPTSMSNNELRDTISRMRMETEYNRLYSELHPKKNSKLKGVVSDILANSAKSIVSKSIDKYFSNNQPKTEEQKAKEHILEFERDLKYETIGNLRSYSSSEIQAVNKYLTQLNLSETTMTTLRDRIQSTT